MLELIGALTVLCVVLVVLGRCLDRAEEWIRDALRERYWRRYERGLTPEQREQVRAGREAANKMTIPPS